MAKKLRTMQTDPARVRRTDPGDPDKCPVWHLHQIYSDEATRQWAAEGCRSAGIGCLECKQPVIDKVVEEISGMRKRAQEFEDNPELVRNIVAEGADKAREAARADAGRGAPRHAPAGGLKACKQRPDLKIVVSNPAAARSAARAAAARAGGDAVRGGNGEPVTQLPRDLYIPPQALEVFLEAFEGPLDLLLYLIRRQNLDILDIPLAEITRQYMQYIELMHDLQLELAGEYLVMAATLAEIKSRMLLPRPAAAMRTARTIRAPSWCAACRSTSASSAPRRASMPCRGSSATCGRPQRRSRSARACARLPQITLQEMLLAFKDVVVRAADVRAPPRAARAALGGRAHERHPGSSGHARLPATSCSCSARKKGAWE